MKKAITLIELMIVVAIIGVLATIAVPNFIAYRNKAKVASAVGSAGSVRAVMASYAVDSISNLFPLDLELPDWDALYNLSTDNGGTLKTTEALQGMSLESYSDLGNGTIAGEDYIFVFYTTGVPAEMSGAQVEVRPSGIEKQTLGGS